MSKKCSGWCAPTIIYAILASVSTVISVIHPDLQDATERVAVFISHVVMGSLWTALLYIMCTYCYNTAAWLLLLIPFILAFIMLFFLAAVVLSVVRNKRGTVHRRRERMQDYQTAYAHNAATIQGSNPPGTLLDLSKLKPDPASPTNLQSVCGFAARPSKFNVLTQKQMQSTGNYIIAPGQQNLEQYNTQFPSGCNEGFPPNPITKYAMPSDLTTI